MLKSSVQEVSQIVEELNQIKILRVKKLVLEKGKNEFTLDIPSTIMFEEGQYEVNKSKCKDFYI